MVYLKCKFYDLFNSRQVFRRSRVATVATTVTVTSVKWCPRRRWSTSTSRKLSFIKRRTLGSPPSSVIIRLWSLRWEFWCWKIRSFETTWFESLKSRSYVDDCYSLLLHILSCKFFADYRIFKLQKTTNRIALNKVLKPITYIMFLLSRGLIRCFFVPVSEWHFVAQGQEHFEQALPSKVWHFGRKIQHRASDRFRGKAQSLHGTCLWKGTNCILTWSLSRKVLIDL